MKDFETMIIKMIKEAKTDDEAKSIVKIISMNTTIEMSTSTMNKPLAMFKTVRQVAASGMISENALRNLIKDDKCPGYKSGNRFMVNVQALSEYLQQL